MFVLRWVKEYNEWKYRQFFLLSLLRTERNVVNLHTVQYKLGITITQFKR
jgi:hypothetical protein